MIPNAHPTDLSRKGWGIIIRFSAPDAEIERQLEKTQVIAETIKASVRENASTAQSGEAFLKKVRSPHRTVRKSRCGIGAIADRTHHPNAAEQENRPVIRTFKKLPETITDRDDTIWTVMVEKAIVHKDGRITFIFKNGTEIKVEE